MNKRVKTGLWAIALTASLLGLLKDNQALLVPVQRWLNQPDLAEQEKARALRPLIACLNQADGRWREAYDRYLSRELHSDPRQLDARERLNYASVHDAYGCQLNALQKGNLEKSAPELLQLQQRFETSLKAVNAVATGFDFFSPKALYSVSPADKADRDSQFIPLARDYLDASDQLRQALDRQDLDLRKVQLEQLKARDKFKYAYVLSYMTQAQNLMLTLDNRVRDQRFSPNDLSMGAQALQDAWDEGSAYFKDHPATSTADSPENLWNYVRAPGQRYLEAVNRMHDHWVSKASAQQLNEDYQRVGGAYDQLIEVYNRQVFDLY
ncbi:DUF3829 domain-containing protein [Pseudomonas atagonensis]|uniref:DUF3829 domain-containing protein n=1 Tax=Pseudomonas atagonensis TaxID=2609964 RepID=UPI00140CDD9E|nr:DUF3829 domain-containing protein [Pseudomonas atagonensis]